MKTQQANIETLAGGKIPRIELKGIKHAAFASHETECYEATLYVDGVKFAHVSNEGRGGCDMVRPIAPYTYADVRTLEDRIKATVPRREACSLFPEGLARDLESLCGDALFEWMGRRDSKRLLSKHVCFTEVRGSETLLMQYRATLKPCAESFAKVRAVVAGRGGIILNELPFEEAHDLILKLSQKA